MSIENAGILYVVATPIGNLGDMSQRAVDTLRQVDLIAAEDTRHSRILLDHWQIQTPMTALHTHNEAPASQAIIRRITQGASVALISDAGTPLMSDPGFVLVRQACAQGIQICPIPGACALIAALSVAGLPVDQWTFIGFLPPKQAARLSRLGSFAQEPRTLICYEAPHRLLLALADAITALGPEREAVVARELTKKFETIHRGTLGELHLWFEEHPEAQRGEFVLVIAGFQPLQTETLPAETQRIFQLLKAELPVNQAVKLTAAITGTKKNLIYNWACHNDSAV